MDMIIARKLSEFKGSFDMLFMILFFLSQVWPHLGYMLLIRGLSGALISMWYPKVLGPKWYRVPLQQSLGLLQGQARSFDVRGVVGFQDQGAATHLTHPSLGQSRGIQKYPGPIDAGHPGGDPVGDREDGFESLCHSGFFKIVIVPHASVLFAAPLGP